MNLPEEDVRGVNKMTENKPQKRKVLVVSIELSELDKELSAEKEIPDSLKTWEDGEEPSREYQELLVTLISLAKLIALKLNTGPETKDSIVKRSVTMKMIIQSILDFTFIDGYHRHGVLSEIMNDIYLKTSGRMLIDSRISKALKYYSKKGIDESKKKVTYVS